MGVLNMTDMVEQIQWKDGDTITSDWMNGVDSSLKENSETLQNQKSKLNAATASVEELQALVSKWSGDLKVANQQLALLQSKMQELDRKDQQRKEISNENPNVDFPNDSIFVNTKQPLEKNGTIKGKRVELGAFHLMGGNLTVESSGDVDIGTFSSVGTIAQPGEHKAALYIKSSGYVTIGKAMMQSDGASAIRIGALNGKPPKAINLNGIDFSKPLEGPAITIEQIAQDGVITISNSTFVNVRNVLELVNSGSPNRFKLLLVNCRISKFNTQAGDKLHGLVLCKDPNADTVEKFYSRKSFGKGIAVIDLVDIKLNNKLVVSSPVEEFVATGDEKQLLAGITKDGTVVPFGTDKNNWPEITIK